MGETPIERNWLEIRLLNHLYDSGHSVGLGDLRENLVAGMGETIVNTLFDMEKEALVTIVGDPGSKRVCITGRGKSALALVEAKGKEGGDGI